MPLDIDSIIRQVCSNSGSPELSEKIFWSFKSIGTCLGKATYFRQLKSGIFYLSSDLWERTPELERYNTIVHEICHITTPHRFGRITPHGKEWKFMMQLNGVVPNRCHSIDVSDIRKKRVHPKLDVYCLCRVHKVTKRIYDKIAKGYPYSCKQCKGKISPRKVG